MRGALRTHVCDSDRVWIIPADAGSTSVRIGDRIVVKDHPRRCGEHMREIGQETPMQGSSPQMRGARADIAS